jgi:hypothetical protein
MTLDRQPEHGTQRSAIFETMFLWTVVIEIDFNEAYRSASDRFWVADRDLSYVRPTVNPSLNTNTTQKCRVRTTLTSRESAHVSCSSRPS